MSEHGPDEPAPGEALLPARRTRDAIPTPGGSHAASPTCLRPRAGSASGPSGRGAQWRRTRRTDRPRAGARGLRRNARFRASATTTRRPSNWSRQRPSRPASSSRRRRRGRSSWPPRPVILYVPIDRARITAIVYHRMEGSDTLDLTPLRQAAQRRHRRPHRAPDHRLRRRPGRTTSSPPARPPAVESARAPAPQVYSPVNGTIVGITPMILNGAAWGSQLSIQPQADPGVVVVVSQLFVDPSLRIGQQVTASQEPTLLGTVADLSKVLKMELAPTPPTPATTRTSSCAPRRCSRFRAGSSSWETCSAPPGCAPWRRT